MHGGGCSVLIVLFFICCAYPEYFWLFVLLLFWFLGSDNKQRPHEKFNTTENKQSSNTAPISNLQKRDINIINSEIDKKVSVNEPDSAQFFMDFIADKEIELYGYKIKNPMIYVSNIYNIKYPFTIFSNAKIQSKGNDVNKFAYRPQFNRLTPLQKCHFIEWLAGGKSDSFIDENYLFTYFYGLEHRALVEKKDLEIILDELMRLYNTLNYQYNIKNYCLNFIEYLIYEIKDFSLEKIKKIISFIVSLPYYSQIDKQNIIFNLTDDFLLCFELEVEKLLSHDFNFNLSQRKMELFLYYAGQSIELQKKYELCNIKKNTLKYKTTNYVIYESKEYKKIIASSELEAFYRQCKKKWKTCEFKTIRNFEGSTKPLLEIEKYINLPNKLKKDIVNPIISMLDAQIIPGTTYEVEKLLRFLGISTKNKLSFALSKLIIDCCESAGYAIEPDARVLNKAYTLEQKVKIFKPEKLESQDSLNYLIPAIYLDCGYQMALEDTKLLDEEQNYIMQYIFNNFDLTPSSKERLICKAELINETKEITTSDIVKKLLVRINDINLERFCKYLVSVAASDNIIQPEEYKLLKKYFKKLDLADSYLDKLLNEITANDNIIVKSPSSKPKKGSAIPIKPINTEAKITLNKNKISDIMLDTLEVQKVLSSIFKEGSMDEETSAETKIQQNTENSDIIDEKYLEFAKLLLEKEDWENNELVNICKNSNLMLNNAIDKINEWADEEFGDFLIEKNNNKIHLNSEIKQAIQLQFER